MRLFALPVFIFFLAILPVSAQSFFDNIHTAYMGNLMLLASDNGSNADPAQIVPMFSFSAAYPVTRFFRIELIEDIYFINYEYNAALGYPMACTPDNRSAFVLGFVTGLQVTLFLPIGEDGTGIRFYGGPAADLRVVILAFGLENPSDFTGNLETDPRMQTDAIADYFWSNGRMLYSTVGLGFDFPMNKKFLLGFDLRAWMPLYRLWTNEDIPAIDGWRFGAGLRITPRKAG